ncbi:MAG: 50S ribosomal protein L22 [Candidatus Diapherotrites archaeon]|uniref:50S ribosomal protein L22 n=1 Tax=Candidatus Iainarchaeum sp. TaxID=3101447 RepID=A0A8T4C9J8_9ARCH|nr:50S ribosomal protein L22 [Candidatus Diapherotrites archaeon]
MVKTNYNYAGTYDAQRMARAFSTNQAASVKYSLEISRMIKGKSLDESVKFLNDVASQKTFLPLRTYHKKVPHRKGQAIVGTKSGRYPQRTCKVWLNILNTVRANADVKGLDVKKLQIVHANATHGFQRIRNQAQGRISGKSRKSKSAHIEVIVREVR